MSIGNTGILSKEISGGNEREIPKGGTNMLYKDPCQKASTVLYNDKLLSNTGIFRKE